MMQSRRPDLDERTELLDWALTAEILGAGFIHRLACAVEHGDADLGIDPVAWANTMTALEWALTEHVHERMQGPTIISDVDVERVRHIHALGSDALAGGTRSPELCALAVECLLALFGPGWESAVQEAEDAWQRIAHGFPPS